MFEIRVICDDSDVPAITKALPTAFTVADMQRARTFDGRKARLYVTADHRPEGAPWPDPETAYRLAPNIIREIGWTARTARDPDLDASDREYWLRKAAVLDRVALSDEAVGIHGDAAEVAAAAAQYLMDLDSAAVICDPRRYVRREYVAWAKNQ